MSIRAPIGVLLMADGGPESLDDLSGYLAAVHSGRPTPQALLAETRQRYAQIGGKSPLLAVARRQAASVEHALNLDGPFFSVYLGMRYWSPWIEETVRDMVADGIGRAVALPLSPCVSPASAALFRKKVEYGLHMYDGSIQFQFIDGYSGVPKFIEALARRVRDGLARWPAESQGRVHVILSAHSVSEGAGEGEAVASALYTAAQAVAVAVGLPDSRWSWAEHPDSASPLPEHLTRLAAQGICDVVIVPIGATCDHIGTLYDIDIEAQAAARELGIRLERPPMLNDDPLYIETLAEQVRERAARWMQRPEAVE